MTWIFSAHYFFSEQSKVIVIHVHCTFVSLLVPDLYDTTMCTKHNMAAEVGEGLEIWTDTHSRGAVQFYQLDSCSEQSNKIVVLLNKAV